jgi:predicted metal-dependent hydrolase
MSDSPPQFQLPPYTYVPGQSRHPISDPQGHSFGARHIECPPPDWQSLPICELFQQARQLFNAGYYWESHEAWEGVWNAAGRSGLVADFVKALIKLAAAGVKLREASPTGAQRHLTRAAELLQTTKSRLEAEPQKEGYNVNTLLELVHNLQQNLPAVPPAEAGQPIVLFGELPES